MRAPNSGFHFVAGICFLALTLVGVLIGVTWCTVAAGLQAVGYLYVAYTTEPDERADGPDPLRATPTGRFRASGWPPSKDPEDYR